MEKFKKAFRRLPDPRADNARHDLLEVLFIALAATLCGAEGPSDMATFGHSKEGLLRLVLQLQHGVPSHDTFSRVFRLLDPKAFEAAFRRFMAGFAKANGLELRGVVAVDGKALRGAFERGRQSTPLHMVNVWAAEARMCLAQRKAPGRNEAAGRWKSWACWTSKAVSLPRMHCTAIATLPPRCSSGVRITCWRSRRTRASCSLRPFGAMRAAESAAWPNGGSPSLTIAASGGARPSCATPVSLRSRSSPASLRWPASPRADACSVPVRSLPRCATSCSPNIFPPSGCCASCAPIGGSRTSCIGCSMSSSTRIATELGKTTRPRTSRYSESSPSIWSAVTPRPRPCARKSNARGGTTPSSWACSVICDSPALVGGVGVGVGVGVGGGGCKLPNALGKQIPPPSPALPHKGGGSRPSLPHE